MKKLLFFITTLEGGGAELILTNTANALSEKYNVTVMTLQDRGKHQSRLSDKVNYKSIIKCKNRFFCRAFSYLLGFVLPPALVHRLFIGNNYDYEIAFLEGIPTKLIAPSKTKKYAWVHIDLYNTFGLEKVFPKMSKHIACYRKYDKIVCVSETVKETFIKRFGILSNLIVKYNIIDDELIKAKSREKIEKGNKLRIVSVGRLAKQKGYDRLLPVLKKIRDDKIAFELMLVGNGGEYESLKNQAQDLGIENSVIFTGYCENPYKYMATADFLVFPSRSEGYSSVVCEAVILGKPVVVSDCSGMREILGDSEYGLVTESDEELYTAIKSMITDADFRRSYEVKAKERAKIFSKEARFDELEKLFKD